MGLSGLGDILLSCTSTRSRNYALGVRLGQAAAGVPMSIHGGRSGGLTEGVATAESVTQLARKLGVTMPIAFTVNDILAGNSDIDVAVGKLLERPLGSEA
jgi:glycerol-3-phosphate dehydrogenase (NAD(P)+)